jgi:hypothetical protein
VALTPFSAIRLLIVSINTFPIVFLVQSSIALITDRWRSRDGFEYACGKAFVARMLGPLTLSLTFLLISLLEHI